MKNGLKFLKQVESKTSQFFIYFLAELRGPEGPPSGASYTYRELNKGNPHFIRASGISRGRVHTTKAATVESRDMAAILQ